MSRKPAPDFSFEQAAMTRGMAPVAGVDEVGRGPWAGPVVAAAVVLDPDKIPQGLNDSKVLSVNRRETLALEIEANAHVGFGLADVHEIDAINILQASLRAMQRAVAALPVSPKFALVDGRILPPDLGCEATALVKGDARSLSVAAASIIAKVKRDAIMRDLAMDFPGYGWETNAGYGTKAHQQGLKRLGVTQHHRRTFRPIHNMLEIENHLTN